MPDYLTLKTKNGGDYFYRYNQSENKNSKQKTGMGFSIIIRSFLA